MLSLVSLDSLAEVYKLVDEDGNITYTDRPASAADTATLAKLSPLNQMPTLLAETADGETEFFAGYNSALIVSPEND